jgi:hypothetical protein
MASLATSMEYMSMWDHPSGPAPVPGNVAPAVSAPVATASKIIAAPLMEQQQQPSLSVAAPAPAVVGLEKEQIEGSSSSSVSPASAAREDKRNKSRLPFFERLTTSLRGGSSKNKTVEPSASSSQLSTASPTSTLKDKRSKSLAQ